MKTAAFEMPSKRMAYYTSAAITKYLAVQWSTAGLLEVADGTKPFAGIVEYGTENANELATIVTGIYPVVASGVITAGDYVSFTAGKAVKVTTGKAFGKAISTTAAADELVGVVTFDAPFTIA